MSDRDGTPKAFLLRVAKLLKEDRELQGALHKLKRSLLQDISEPRPDHLLEIIARAYALGTAGLLSAVEESFRSEDTPASHMTESSHALQLAGDTFLKVSWYVQQAEGTRSAAQRLRVHAAVCFFLAGYTANARVALSGVRVRKLDSVSLVDLHAEPDKLLVLMVRQDFSRIEQRSTRFLRSKEHLAEALRNDPPCEGDMVRFLGAMSIVSACHSFVDYLKTGRLDARVGADELLVQAGQLYQAVGDAAGFLLVSELRGVIHHLQTRSIWATVGTYLIGPKFIGYLQLLAQTAPVIWESQHSVLGDGLLDTSHRRLLLTLPTSSGKTLLAEWCLAQTLLADQTATCIYIAPTVALASQVESDLKVRLGGAGLGLSMVSITGSYDVTDMDEARAGDCRILIATPEKLDSLTRRPLERLLPCLKNPRLIVVDECQLVGQEKRGVQLELLLIRLRSKYPDARIVGLSAVLQNPQEIANWLRSDHPSKTQNQGYLRSAWRPTRLHGAVLRSGGKLDYVERDDAGAIRDQFMVQTGVKDSWTLKRKAAWLAVHYAQISTIRNVMVFSNSVSRCIELASEIEQVLQTDQRGFPFDLARTDDEKREWRDSLGRLRSRLEATVDALYLPALLRLASNGIAIHHAALSPETKAITEEYLRSGHVRIVVATATLAEGVNLPVGCVIAPYLSFFDRASGTSKAMPYSFFKNIAGRSGRARFHTEGHIVILDDDEQYLDPRISEQITSQLPAVIAAYRGPMSATQDPRVLAYQSGLLAILCEPSAQDTVVDSLANCSLAKVQKSAPEFQAFSHGLGAVNERLFEELTKPIPGHPLQPFTRNSPLRPTELGRTMAMTGLSIDSCRQLMLGVVGLLGRRNSSQELTQLRLSDHTLRQILGPVLELKELTTHDLFDPFFGRTDIILAWLRGQPVESIGEDLFRLRLAQKVSHNKTLTRPRPINEKALKNDAMMDCMDLFRRLVSQHLPWLAYGFVRLFEYEWERVYGETQFCPDLHYLPLYLRHGVDSPVAARLAEAGLRERLGAMWLSQLYSQDVLDLPWPPSLADWLSELDLSERQPPIGVNRVQVAADVRKILKNNLLV